MCLCVSAVEGILLPALTKPLVKVNFDDVDQKIDDLTEKDLKFDGRIYIYIF